MYTQTESIKVNCGYITESITTDSRDPVRCEGVRTDLWFCLSVPKLMTILLCILNMNEKRTYRGIKSRQNMPISLTDQVSTGDKGGSANTPGGKHSNVKSRGMTSETLSNLHQTGPKEIAASNFIIGTERAISHERTALKTKAAMFCRTIPCHQPNEHTVNKLSIVLQFGTRQNLLARDEWILL